MKPALFEYVVVDSAAQAVEALGRFDGDARCLAGGQSLVPLLNMRLMRPAAVVDINRVPGLDGIEVGDGVVRIGALARYSTLERSALVQERLPLLARAVPFVGDRQIRNRGTLGGALCHADPAGEMALTAVTLGGSISVASPAGRREIAVEDFGDKYCLNSICFIGKLTGWAVGACGPSVFKTNDGGRTWTRQLGLETGD